MCKVRAKSCRLLLVAVSIYCTLCSDSLLTTRDGGYAPPADILDQGRINVIEWGTSTLNGALIISSWSADRQSSKDLTFGTDTYSVCTPVILDSDDYILGYKSYFDSFYVYGLELYTLKGVTFACYNSEIISDKSATTVPQSTYYNNNDDFYYLSGWIIYAGSKISGIQLQFTHIATVHALVETLPDSSFSASSLGEEGGQYDAASDAKYSSWGWGPDGSSVGEWLRLDLLRPVQITAIGTKGASAAYVYDQWTTRYEFSWSLNEDEWDSNNSLILDGNFDLDTEVLHTFNDDNEDDDIVIAQFVQFTALEWYGYIAFRVEIYARDIVTAEYQPISITTTSSTIDIDGGNEDEQQAISMKTVILIVLLAAVFMVCFVVLLAVGVYYQTRGQRKREEAEQEMAEQVVVYANEKQGNGEIGMHEAQISGSLTSRNEGEFQTEGNEAQSKTPQTRTAAAEV